MLYRIGDFSEKVGVPVKTLRYYDEIDLFKPSYTERFSGYRYYEINQIKDIKLISKLKEIGLSLEEVKQFQKSKDVSIILNKKKLFEEKLERIEEFMNIKEDMPIYNIEEEDYRKYVEINGIKYSKCAQALALKDLNARYFVVYKDDEFYTDFCIYKKDNWLTLDRKLFLENELVDLIIDYISVEFDYFIFYIPKEDEKLYKTIKSKFNNVEEETYIQDSYEYYRMRVSLIDSFHKIG